MLIKTKSKIQQNRRFPLIEKRSFKNMTMKTTKIKEWKKIPNRMELNPRIS